MTTPNAAIEQTVFNFLTAVHGYDNVLVGPLNGFGMFGWKMEAGGSPYPDEMQGDSDYGIAYLKHMTAQGFEVAFAVWKEPNRALVCLKTWEPGEVEPPWPKDTADAYVWHAQ